MRNATGDNMGVSGCFLARQQNGGDESFGGDSSYHVFVFSDEAGEGLGCVSCVHYVLVACPFLKSDFPGHLKGNFDTRLTVTLNMTTVVKSV